MIQVFGYRQKCEKNQNTYFEGAAGAKNRVFIVFSLYFLLVPAYIMILKFLSNFPPYII